MACSTRYVVASRAVAKSLGWVASDCQSSPPSIYIETEIAGTPKNAASTAALTVPERPKTYAPRFPPLLQPETTRSTSGQIEPRPAITQSTGVP